ncbi:hypothetical protein C8J56DRAFT_1119124 [Mycena floridula]|nr:hypothetical protein C8J56DRAFT_1119124 [Mycena floridula]
MFGAVRNEPDAFTDAFLKEIRSRPDLFSVITRSDTDPGRQTESFGDTCDQIRTRTFEAPPAPTSQTPAGHGEWKAMRSGLDILYGTATGPLKRDGHLTTLERSDSAGWFFHFKTFPVKYFVILDAVPNRHVHHLARQVSWAALRAYGLVTGEYRQDIYAKEKLSFLPPEAWSVGNLMSED